MTNQIVSSEEIDLTYYEAQPPRMVDTKTFPPSESMRKQYAEVELKLDEVIDPDYPWQLLDHDTPGGKKRIEEIKKQKAEKVLNYTIVRSRFWKQFRDPQYFHDNCKMTNSYTVGFSHTKENSIEADLEICLGLKKGVFKGSLKTSLKWNSTTEGTFSKSVTKTIEQNYEGECWYFYWQTIDDLSVYRRINENPNVLEPIENISDPSNLVMTDKFRMSMANDNAPVVGASKVNLEPGESHVFGGYVFSNTKIYAKNTSNNDDGELTIIWLSRGTKNILKVGPNETKHMEKYMPTDFKATNSSSSAKVNLEVWKDA